MSGNKKATSEQSSVLEGAGYNELYSSGCEPKEYLSSSLERKLSAHSLTKKDEEYEEGEEVVGDEDKEGEGEEKVRGMMRAMSRSWSVKRLATVRGLSSFPLYGR